MARKWTPPDVDELVRLYLAGETEQQLAGRYGVTRIPIVRALTEAGVTRRTPAETNRLLAARRTPEQRRAGVAAAHAARRGSTDSFEVLCKRAKTREERQTHVSPAEQLIAAWLADRGEDATPQKAIGPYNADLAVGAVAVEIHGGGWHSGGRHRARAPKRIRYILDEGWNLMVIWVDRRSHPLTRKAADQVISFAEESRRNPSMRGEQRVIWGDGQPVDSAFRRQLD